MSVEQKQAVYVAVLNLLAEKGIPFDDGQKPSASELLSSADRKNVIQLIAEGLQNGEIAFKAESKAKHEEAGTIGKYAAECVSNHLRKDERLNGGEKYEIKNPGSRAGTSDPAIKALRNLKKRYTDDPSTLALIDSELEMRLANQAAPKVPTINVEHLPEHLRHLVK